WRWDGRAGGPGQALCNRLFFNYTAGRRQWGPAAFSRRVVADGRGVGFPAGAISGPFFGCPGPGGWPADFYEVWAMAHGAPGGGGATAATPGHDTGETRRDFLMLATGAVGAFGVAAVAWPFIDQMNPAQDVLALATTEVDISKIAEGQAITVK